jgi:hypothetical protein
MPFLKGFLKLKLLICEKSQIKRLPLSMIDRRDTYWKLEILVTLNVKACIYISKIPLSLADFTPFK